MSFSEFAYFVPILTFLFSLYFARELWIHYKSKPESTHVLWWFIGIITYAIGTFTESYHALFGWSTINFKVWYISGALLGGAPLAQGTVFLLMRKSLANKLSIFLIGYILIAASLIALSPIVTNAAELNRLTGTLLGWQWTRIFSPVINIYALVFLVGGAIWSAMKYAKESNQKNRFYGNVLIAIGALLPGIGGTFTRFGFEEVLFITELIGVLFIFRGYKVIRNEQSPSIHVIQST